MAKRSKRNERARSLYSHPIASVLAAPLYRPRLPVFSFSPILELEDRRLWHPQRFTQAALASVRSAARLIPRPPRTTSARSRATLFSSPPIRIGFAQPRKVALCVRRNIRKEVLHAKRVAGSGARSFKRRHYNKFSQIGC